MHRASVRPTEPVYAPDGTPWSYHVQSATSYYSLFGKVQFERHYYYVSGHGGLCPLDAELSLPPRCYSDLLRDWAEYCVTDESYDETIKVLERILRLSVSKQALDTGPQEDADDVVAFYEQKAAPPVETEGPILVAQADGRGVPMVRSGSAPQPARLSKGQKRSMKKEAVTTGIYTIEPHHRTPQDVVEALMHDREGNESAPQASSPPSPRPTPPNKEVSATLEGKDIAFERLAQRVAQRDHGGIRRRVALTDGDDALQRQVGDTLPTPQLMLDIIHASEDYLWDTANALWVRPMRLADSDARVGNSQSDISK